MKFLDIVNCFNLAQHITVPTHKDGHTLDLIITRNDEDLISDINVRDPLISDYFACFCSWNVCKPNTRRIHTTYRKLLNIDHKGFGRDLADSPLLSASASDLSVSELSDRYQSVLSSVLEAHASLQRKTTSARPSEPWYNNEIASQKTLRRELERRSGGVQNWTLIDRHAPTNVFVFKT